MPHASFVPRKRVYCLVLALLLCANLLAVNAQVESSFTGPPGFSAYPPLDSAGFLADEALEPEFVYVSEEEGRWLYISADLRVDISRFQGKHGKDKLVYFLADIRFRGEQAFRAYLANPKSPLSQARPHEIARKNQVVFAQNGDLFSWRIYNKQLSGVIIRGGKLLHKGSYKKATLAVPPLDELALFPDGHIEMHYPGSQSPQQYLERGASDVLAFGPILFRGEEMDSRLNKSFTHKEPRSALGVVEPGHFIGVMVEGRNKRSVGANLQFVAQLLMDAGCKEAFTLDGGQTAAIIFMGQQVMDPGIYKGFQHARKQQDIIGIGQSEQVPQK